MWDKMPIDHWQNREQGDSFCMRVKTSWQTAILKPRLHDTTCCQTGCQAGLIDNRVNVCIHDTTGCQTGLTTGCIVYTNIQPVVKPVWQPVVSCKRGFKIAVCQLVFTRIQNESPCSRFCQWSIGILSHISYAKCFAVKYPVSVKLAATLRWFTAGGAIRIAVRQLSQTWKLRHYDVIDDVITRKL